MGETMTAIAEQHIPHLGSDWGAALSACVASARADADRIVTNGESSRWAHNQGRTNTSRVSSVGAVDLADQMIRSSTPAEAEPDNAIFGSNLREAARAIGIIRRWWTGRAARR